MQDSLKMHAFRNAENAECELLRLYLEPCL